MNGESTPVSSLMGGSVFAHHISAADIVLGSTGRVSPIKAAKASIVHYNAAFNCAETPSERAQALQAKGVAQHVIGDLDFAQMTLEKALQEAPQLKMGLIARIMRDLALVNADVAIMHSFSKDIMSRVAASEEAGILFFQSIEAFKESGESSARAEVLVTKAYSVATLCILTTEHSIRKAYRQDLAKLTAQIGKLRPRRYDDHFLAVSLRLKCESVIKQLGLAPISTHLSDKCGHGGGMRGLFVSARIIDNPYLRRLG